MARCFINDLSAGQMLQDAVFLLTQKDLRTTTNGSLYIHAVLADKTGQLPARIWQATEELYKLLPQEGLIKIRGKAENYKGSMQIIIEGVQNVDAADVDIADFLPKTDKDIDQMFKRVVEILRNIKDRNLLYLIKQFLDDTDLMDKFRQTPAAVQMHHACIGGLLEHTLNIMELALVVGPRYSQINMDLAIVGAFLHDMGKTAELRCDTSFKYTDGGQLIGHLVMAAMMIETHARKAEAALDQPFPQHLLHILQHMVLSHHGDYEFGSPKLPMTAEAVMLHYLDNLDAKLETVRLQIDQSEATDPETNWTGYIRSLERRLFKGQVFDPTSDD